MFLDKPIIKEEILEIFSLKCEGYPIPQDKILNFYEYFEILGSNEFIIKFPRDSHYFIEENSSKNFVSSENIWKKR